MLIKKYFTGEVFIKFKGIYLKKITTNIESYLNVKFYQKLIKKIPFYLMGILIDKYDWTHEKIRRNVLVLPCNCIYDSVLDFKTPTTLTHRNMLTEYSQNFIKMLASGKNDRFCPQTMWHSLWHSWKEKDFVTIWSFTKPSKWKYF